MIDIHVVASNHRPSLIVEYLKDIKYNINYTPDYPYGINDLKNIKYKNFTMSFNLKNQTGAYRCFRGHQDVLGKMSGKYALVFEDDAVPNRDDWLQLVEEAAELLNSFEVVSLHGRNIKNEIKRKSHKNITYVTLGEYRDGLKFAYGSLAYIIGEESAKKICAMKYEGLPMDLLLINRFNACIIDPSPFDHDRRFGSLVEKPK